MFGVILAGGCKSAPESNQDLSLLVLDDADRSINTRLDAVGPIDPADALRWKQVSGVAWSAKEPVRLRVELLERLRRADPGRFWGDATDRLVGERSPEVADYLLAAAELDGPDAASAVLRRWAAVGDTPRGLLREGDVFSTIHNEADLDTLLRDWVASDRPIADGIAAWEVLARRESGDQLRAWLRKQPEASGLVVDLRAAAEWLDELPTNRETVLWLRVLRSYHPELWGRAEEQIASFDSTLRYGLALRHLPMLATQAPRLETGAIQLVGHGDWHPPKGRPLSILNAGLIGYLQQNLARKEIHENLFLQADADHADTTTEHGGLLREIDGAWRFVAYPPGRREHDRAFHPSSKMTWDQYTALASYHFHAETHHNAEHAGAGSGDRRLVERTRMPMIVFTFLDHDRLQATLVLPDHINAELGVIHRYNGWQSPASP